MPSIPIVGDLTPTKIIAIAGAAAFAFLYFRESFNKGIGATTQGLGQGIGSVGTGLGQFGVGIGSGLSGLLLPFKTALGIIGDAKKLIYGTTPASTSSTPASSTRVQSVAKHEAVVTPASREYSDV